MYNDDCMDHNSEADRDDYDEPLAASRTSTKELSMTKSRRQQIEEMLADEPNDAFLRYGLAMEYVSAGNDEAAARCFQELVAVAPDYVPAYLQAGQVLLRLGRSGDARTFWGQGITVARKAGDAHAAEEMQGFMAGLDD